jgi:ectoine hydroxylase-related dioxygenase (phytanoyl-CoA dioxygenase family)
LEFGSLSLLEKSHQKGETLRNYLSRDVDSYCSNRPGADAAKKTDNFLWDGALSKNPVSLQAKLGGRWLTAEFRAGDVVTFGMTTVHGSLDNQTDRIRLSSDCRYQLASEQIDNRWVGAVPPGHSRAGKMGRVC